MSIGVLACCISIGALALVSYRLVLWFVFYVDLWSGSCFLSVDALVRVFISIDTLVRVLHRLVIWFVFYIDWCSGSCVISIVDVAHVLYGLVTWLELYVLYICVFVSECYTETMLTWPCGKHKKVLLKTEEPTSGRPWTEANRDMIHSRSGAPLPTHTHSVLCKVYYSVRMIISKQGWAESCLCDFTAICLKPPSFWEATHHLVLSCRRFEWTW